MRTKLTLIAICHLLSAIFEMAFAQGTAFTYQGQLNNGGSPANGSYDFKLILYDAANAGNILAGPITNAAVAVSNGLFTMTVDFGPGVFIGESNWLHLAVSTNGAGSFVALSPRQQLTPAPNAIFAENANAAGLSGTLSSSSLGGTYGNAVNFNNGADSFDGSFYGDFYGAIFTGGNFVGNFVGTGSSLTDVWHAGGNFGTTAGADFVGTTDNQPLEFHVNNLRALRLEPTTNTSFASGAVNVIGGSSANIVVPGVLGATIAGGGAPYYFGGGTENMIADNFGTIGGGVNNEIQSNAYESTIGGGNANSILPGAYRSTISGGWANTVGTNSTHSVIGGGFDNSTWTNCWYSVIGGGEGNFADTAWAVIAGGYYNTNAGLVSFIGAGDLNLVQGGVYYSVIGGGVYNQVQTGASYSVIGGGLRDQVNSGAPYSFLGGGLNNQIYGDTNSYGTGVIAGGDANTINSNSWNSFIGGGQGNNIGSSSDHSTVGGGFGNVIQTNSPGSTIGGGEENQIQSSFYVGAIAANTVVGGIYNLIQSNVLYATIGGGQFNTNNGYSATIPGGDGNYAAGNFSLAAGYHAQALYNGDFVWADSQNTNFAATTSDQVSFRCQGGVRFTSGGSTADQTVSWTPGSASWSFSSDRNLKDRFESVDDESVLARVAQLRILEWSYKGYSQRHIGAMAQDFHALFPLNNDDKTLNDADLHGVELAAIQGLNQKLNEKDAEIRELQHNVAQLRAMVLQSTRTKSK
ncbi:MAG TPA: tail fiber domain-containing protein [Verrucomicrobiae bacterium]|nr:tail fiber domain-containing protein [Verrucomicrobiae bacterium]